MASLPNELISHVLDLSLRSDVLQAAAISRRWRTVAVGRDDFYFTVRLDVGYPKHNNYWTQRMQHRNAEVLTSELPLRILLTRLDNRQRAVYEIAWRGHLENVASRMSRVKAFSINADGSLIKDAFALFSTVAAPMLHTLHIDVQTVGSTRNSAEEQPNILNPALFQRSAPRLRTLYLSELRLFPVAVAAFANVQDLQIYARDSHESIGLPLATCFPSLRLLSLDGILESYATCGATIPSTLKFLYAKNKEFELPTATINQLFRSIGRSLPTVHRVTLQTVVSNVLDLALFTRGLTGDLWLSCQVTDIVDDADPSFYFETAVTSLTTGLERIFNYAFRKADEIILSSLALLLNQITVIDVTHISIARLSEIGHEFPAVIHLCIDVIKRLSPELWPNADWDGDRKIFGHRANVFPNLKELAIQKNVFVDPITPAIQIELVELEQLILDLGLQSAQIKLSLTKVTLETGDPIHAAAVMSKFRDVVYN